MRAQDSSVLVGDGIRFCLRPLGLWRLLSIEGLVSNAAIAGTSKGTCIPFSQPHRDDGAFPARSAFPAWPFDPFLQWPSKQRHIACFAMKLEQCTYELGLNKLRRLWSILVLCVTKGVFFV